MSASLDLIDADLDAEVANLAGQQKQPQTPLPSTSGVKTNSQVLFQPIFPAYATLAQHRDQVLFNPSLNLIYDSPRPQISVSAAHRPQQPAPPVNMPPTPYVNQATVNQHMNGQPTQPHRIPAGAENRQQQQPPRLVHHGAQQMLSQCLYHSFKIHQLTLGPKVKMDRA